MFLRSTDDAAIAALWLQIQTLQDYHENELAATLAAATLAALRLIGDKVRAGLPVDLDAFLQSQVRDVTNVFSGSIIATADTFGQHVMAGAGMQEHAKDWLGTAMGAGGLAGLIATASDRYANATQLRVAKVIRMNEGPRLAAWARLIGVENDQRARNAAAAEVYTASQVATQAAAELTGKVQKRMWMCRLDGRERIAHHDAHKQIVGLNESYIVGGERMRFPGDPRCSVHNWINCRCASALIMR